MGTVVSGSGVGCFLWRNNNWTGCSGSAIMGGLIDCAATCTCNPNIAFNERDVLLYMTLLDAVDSIWYQTFH
jgi:hypothetical protein